MAFIHDDFLLSTKTARRLFHEFAADQPILDYHCHLPPQDVAANRQFRNLAEIWLEGDHYKWRAMRANGIAERYCTGDAPPRVNGRRSRNGRMRASRAINRLAIQAVSRRRSLTRSSGLPAKQ